VLLDTISIMGGALGKGELTAADVVIRPELRGLPATNFQQRHEAILEGEKVGFAAIARIREAIAAWERKHG
jgi:NTE family protein